MADNAPPHSVNNRNVVEVQARSIDDLFSRFDPAALSGRSISPDVDSYIVGQLIKFTDESAVSLHINLPADEASYGHIVQQAFRHHYALSSARCRAELKQHFRDAGFMLLKGVIFALVLIGIAHVVAEIAERVYINKIVAGLSLIVWVSLWKPIDMLIYEWIPIMDKVKLHDRLDGCEVTCSFTGDSSRDE